MLLFPELLKGFVALFLILMGIHPFCILHFFHHRFH
ncbi:DUF3096 domain-containing protein [Lactobacillus sp. SL9-6]|nr:DUF3096 domain-containing protein [Lactobacillus sp. SL9-6]